MPGHYSTIVNLDEVVLSDYQQRVFREAQRLLAETSDSGTGETILPDTYVIQKELLTTITSNPVDSREDERNFKDDASRLVNRLLDIEEVEIVTPPVFETPVSVSPVNPAPLAVSPVNPVVLGTDSLATDSIAVLPTSPANNISTSFTDSAVNTSTLFTDSAV